MSTAQSNMQAAPVEMINTVTVVGPQFCAPYPIDLTVKGSTWSLTGNDFTVRDCNGNIVFKMKGQLLSLRGKCILTDSHANSILSMERKIWSIHERWNVFMGESSDPRNLLFTVKKSSLFQLKTSLDVYLAANTRENMPDFTVRGSYFERSCTIYLGKFTTVIAQMRKQHVCKDIFGVTVYPNVDYALIVALILVLDQINKDQTD